MLFNGDGLEYPGELVVTGKQLRVQLDEPRPGLPESPLGLILLAGISRGQRMDLVIQKATELGAAAIRPIASERSVVRLDAARVEARLRHWRSIAVAAAEQCGRAGVPSVAEPARLADCLAALPAGGSRLLLDPTGQPRLTAAVRSWPPLVVLCGPEGGLSEPERRLAVAQGFTAVALGPRILRTETAPLAALAILQYRFGDLANRG